MTDQSHVRQLSGPEGCVGIDFGGTKVAVAARTGDGNLRSVQHVFGADASATQVAQAAEQLIAELQLACVTAVGIATPGSLVDGGLLCAPNVAGWEEFPLEDWAAQTFPGAKIRVVNDVKAAALAEASAGRLSGQQVGIYFNLGTGVAAAVIVSGKPVSGQLGLAGEIGYAPINSALAQSATLEEFAGGVGFAKLGLRVPETPDESWLRSADGIAAATRIDELGSALATCVLLIAPEVVVLGGGMAANRYIFDRLAHQITAACPFPVQVLLSEFDENASLHGALFAAEEAR